MWLARKSLPGVPVLPSKIAEQELANKVAVDSTHREIVYSLLAASIEDQFYEDIEALRNGTADRVLVREAKEMADEVARRCVETLMRHYVDKSVLKKMSMTDTAVSAAEKDMS